MLSIILFSNQTTQLQRCPIDPYHIMPDKCRCIDFQTLKLQENPEDVPHGEMPRHMQLYCDRLVHADISLARSSKLEDEYIVDLQF